MYAFKPWCGVSYFLGFVLQNTIFLNAPLLVFVKGCSYIFVTCFSWSPSWSFLHFPYFKYPPCCTFLSYIFLTCPNYHFYDLLRWSFLFFNNFDSYFFYNCDVKSSIFRIFLLSVIYLFLLTIILLVFSVLYVKFFI